MSEQTTPADAVGSSAELGSCARPAGQMSPWLPINDPEMQRRIGKSSEELSELLAVFARIGIQGMDEIDPSSGKTNRQRMHEETADVLAQLACNMRAFGMDAEAIRRRQALKEAQMAEWEAILLEPNAGDQRP